MGKSTYTHHKNGMTRSEYRKVHPEFYEKARQIGGRYTHLHNGMTRSEYFKAHPELSQAAQAGADRFRGSPEGKQLLAENARRLNADGILGRKGPIPQGERDAQGQRMRDNNPMKRPEVREKVRKAAASRKPELVARINRLRAEGKMGNPPPLTAEQREATRKRMSVNNPMRNPEVRARVAQTLRNQYATDRKAMVERWVNAGIAPNKAEMSLEEMIAPLGFRFVGDGRFWIGPCQSGKCRNPDFVYETGRRKIAILLNGKYWHSLPKSDDNQAMADYAALGWRVFVVWDSELNQSTLLSRIKDWLIGLA